MAACPLLLLLLLLLLLPRATLPARVMLQSPRADSHHYQFGGDGLRFEIKLRPDGDALEQQKTTLAMVLQGDRVDVCMVLALYGASGPGREHAQCSAASSQQLRAYQAAQENAVIDVTLVVPWRVLDAAFDRAGGGNVSSAAFTIQVHVVAYEDRSLVLATPHPTKFFYNGKISAKDVLDSPAYVISLAKRRSSRWETTKTRLRGAGFNKIVRFPAVDGSRFESVRELEDKFGIMWGSKGHRACSASHTSLWAFLLERRKSDKVFTIFEDDALPHEYFKEILDTYLSASPSRAEVIYLGWQRGAIQAGGVVHVDPPTDATMPLVLKRHPACLHAYVVTPAALEKLLRLVLPLHDTVDGKVMRLAWKGQLQSFAFNGMRNVSSMLETDLTDEDVQSNVELSFDGETDAQIANDVKAGTLCPSGNCPYLVVSRMDRSRGIVHQDATMGTDIDAQRFEDDEAPSLSRYAKKKKV